MRSTDAPLALPGAQPTDVDRAIAQHAVEYVPSGATLQTGIIVQADQRHCSPRG